MTIPIIVIFGSLILLLVIWIKQQRGQVADLKGQLYYAHKESSEARRLQENYNALREGFFIVMEDALLILDKNAIITFANKSAKEMFDRPCEDQTIMLATRNFELDKLVQSAIEQPNEIIERRLTLGQNILQVRVLCTGVYTLIVLHDVTVMQQLSRARREMIANISHELNTPITTIGLLADTLLSGAAENPKVRTKMLHNIRHEADTLTQLVQEMRDLSLIESRQMPIKLVSTELLPLVKRSIDGLNPLAQRKKQTIASSIPDNVVVLADQQQIFRVIKNMLHNAIKFAPENGQIKVSAMERDEEIVIQVSDTGPGISPFDLPRIFERFFQADQSRQQGTGLGLAIARHIVLGHGGEIWAENNADQGASFFFTLAKSTDKHADILIEENATPSIKN